MSTSISMSHSDEAFYRDRTAWLMYPVIVLPFIAALFYIFGGGKGERYIAEEAALGKPGSGGFNASVPTAKNGTISGRDMQKPGYGQATRQVLSSFTGTRRDSVSGGIHAIPANNQPTAASTNHASSLASATPQPVNVAPTSNQPANRPLRGSKRALGKAQSGYYYNAPKGSTYSTASDQQLASQIRTYESARQSTGQSANLSQNQPTGDAMSVNRVGEDTRAANILVSDNLTATRLSESANAADAFFTAPTSGSRRQAERAVLSGGNSYGSKKTVAWMIPVVVHEDQTVKSGNTVKLRLTKEISADGITIPANTILYAICQTSDDRLRMVVRSLQLNGQLIPLDLEVYDIDGIAGVNMPGLSNQVGDQLQSSAIQGLQVPGVGGLVNTVANQARMSASNSARQPTVRLKAGYNLYLKAQ